MSENSGEGEQGEALLPCPFCGEMPVVNCDESAITCDCGAWFGNFSRVRLYFGWNRRAPASTVAGAQEKEELHEIEEEIGETDVGYWPIPTPLEKPEPSADK